MRADGFEPVGAEIEVGYTVTGHSQPAAASAFGLEFSVTQLPAVPCAATLVMNVAPDLWHLGTTALGQWIESNDYRITDWQREVWHTYSLDDEKAPVIECQWPVELAGGE